MQDNHTCFRVPDGQRLSLAVLFGGTVAELTWSLTAIDELLETFDPRRWRAILACSFNYKIEPGRTR